MSYDLSIQPEAEAVLSEARDWYEDQREGVGLAFIHEVGRTLTDITKAPLHRRLLKFGVRKKLLPRYPYCIDYLDQDYTVGVVAILHVARHPGLIRGRLFEED